MTEEKWYDASSFSVKDGGVPYSTSARPVSGPEWIERATMEDDFFFCEVMNGNRCLASLILNTFLPFPVSDVRSVVTQSTHGWKDKKGVRYDCLVRDGEGNIYEIEMQRRSEPYLNERMWYYISRMTGSIVKKGDGYSKLRGRKVASLFLLETDVFKRGDAVYTYSVRDDDTHTPLGAGGLYVYVNLGYRGDDRKGRVIHDIRCSDWREAYCSEFKRSIREAKSEGGLRMCETLEMFKRYGFEEGRTEANVQAISNLLKDNLVTPEQLSKSFNMPLSEVLEIEKSLK